MKLQKDWVEIGITVRDIDASMAFYRDLLGFEVAAELPVNWGGTMRILQHGNAIVKLLVNDDPAHVSNPPDGPEGGYGLRWITLWVHEIDELIESCAQAGYKVPIPVNRDYPGVKFGMVSDPEGNWIELVEQLDE